MSERIEALADKIGWNRAQFRFLMRWLALPMTGLAIACIVAARAVESEILRDILLSMATGFLGVLLTVFYVEVLLERQQRLEWAATTRLVSQSMKRTALLRATDLLSMQAGFPAAYRRRAYAAIARPDLVIDPAMVRAYQGMTGAFQIWLTSHTVEEWLRLGERLLEISREYAAELALMGARFSPEAYYLVARNEGLAESIGLILRDYADDVRRSLVSQDDGSGPDGESSELFGQLVQDGLAEFLANSLAICLLDDEE